MTEYCPTKESAMLKIYGPIISRALRCFWTAEELECPYERVNIDLMKGEQARPPALRGLLEQI